jgi:hypothetical protein
VPRAPICIFPIDREAVHRIQGGSREAIEQFTAYLKEWPGDLRIRWLLNLGTRADYDNDGDLDVLLLRGGWEKPAKLSLLRNNGNGIFEDQTIASGLGEPIASESAAWGDYDNDGLVDVFVCGEYAGRPSNQPTFRPDSHNRCRLSQ